MKKNVRYFSQNFLSSCRLFCNSCSNATPCQRTWTQLHILTHTHTHTNAQLFTHSAPVLMWAQDTVATTLVCTSDPKPTKSHDCHMNSWIHWLYSWLEVQGHKGVVTLALNRLIIISSYYSNRKNDHSFNDPASKEEVTWYVGGYHIKESATTLCKGHCPWKKKKALPLNKGQFGNACE